MVPFMVTTSIAIRKGGRGWGGQNHERVDSNFPNERWIPYGFAR